MRTSLLIAVLCLSAAGSAQELASTTDTPSPDDLYQMAEKAYGSGAYEKAITLYGQVLDLDPEHLNAYLHRGFCHSLVRDYEHAVQDFTAVIQRKGDHLWAYTSRGSAYNKLHRYDLALADFDKVIALDPRNEEAYNNRGWTRKGMGDQKGACQDWRTSHKMGNAEARIILTNNRCK